MERDVYDLTIVGGGPTGLFAAYYSGLRHMRTKIIDSLDQLGGQLTALYPEKLIYDVAGFPGVVARDLVANLVKQGLQYNPTVCLSETVETLESESEPRVYTIKSNKGTHHTKAVLLSAGVGAFQSKKIPLSEASQWEGRGVHYAVKDKNAFAGKKLLIIGGGDSAIDWALNLHGVAKEITLIHRRNEFRAHEASVKHAISNGTRILTFFEIKSIESSDGKLVGAVVEHNKTRECKPLEVDAILVQIGFNSSLGAIRQWPLKFNGQQIVVDAHMQTNLPGVFSAGDVASYDGKLKLIATGFGEAAIAVNFAKTYLDPNAKAFPGHSSEMSPQTVTTVA